MTSTEVPRDASGHVIRPKPSQLLMDVMDKLGPDHPTSRQLLAALVERDQGIGVEPRATTPVYGWHIPVLSDAPNVPYDMQENSLDIEATISSVSTAAAGDLLHATGNYSGAPPNGTQVFWALDTQVKKVGTALTLVGGDIRVEQTGLYRIWGSLSWNITGDAFVQTGMTDLNLTAGALIRLGAAAFTSPTARYIAGYRASTAGGLARLDEDINPTALTVLSIYGKLTVTAL